MRINNRQFKGERPKIGERNIGTDDAQLAIDCELTSTGIRSVRTNSFVERSDKPIKTLYNFQGQWLSWDKRIDVAESPIGVDNVRVFWTGEGIPMQATAEEFSRGQYTRMGVPTPVAPRTSGVTGDAAEAGTTAITTSYVATFVNKYGEEGDASVPSDLVDYLRGQHVRVIALGEWRENREALTNFDSVVATRLYRLDEGEFKFVTEQPLTATTFSDDTAATLGEVFSTQDFVPPPEDMIGLHIMANDIALGFVGRTVYVSEPGQPNAWPYNFPVQSDIVGISSYDNTAVILTTGYPELATIYDPLNISPSVLAQREPCVSRFSIVQGAGGVIYATPSNLQYIGSGGARNLTNDYFDERSWARIKPQSFHAAFRDGEYFAFHEGEAEGRCYIFDTREANAFVRQLSRYADAVHVLRGTDELYLGVGDIIERFQGDTDRLEYTWKSKEHGLASPAALQRLRVISRDLITVDEAAAQAAQTRAIALADVAAAMSARSIIGEANGYGGAINQDTLGGAGFYAMPGIVDTEQQQQPAGVAINAGADYPLPRQPLQAQLTVSVFGDKQLVDQIDVPDEEVHTIAYADRYRRWAYTLVGNADVEQFDMAGSASEMHDGS